MPQNFEQHEEVKSSQVKEVNADDLSQKAQEQKDSLIHESEKLNTSIGVPRNPDEVSQKESADEARDVLKNNSILKSVLEGTTEFDNAKLAKTCIEKADTVVSEKTELSPDQVTTMEAEVNQLTEELENNPEQAYELLVGLNPSLM